VSAKNKQIDTEFWKLGIPERIRECAKKTGSMHLLIQYSGISESNMYVILAGGNTSLESISKIAKASNRSLTWMLTGLKFSRIQERPKIKFHTVFLPCCGKKHWFYSEQFELLPEKKIDDYLLICYSCGREMHLDASFSDDEAYFSIHYTNRDSLERVSS